MVFVSTVYMVPTMSREYLIPVYQFLWFGTMMNHYLINPDQFRAFNIPVHDNPFDATVFESEVYKTFTSFTSKGGLFIFESRVNGKVRLELTSRFYYRVPMVSYECGDWE